LADSDFRFGHRQLQYAGIDATVLAIFNIGHPIVLAPLGNGLYSSTWTPQSQEIPQITLRATKTGLTAASIALSGMVVPFDVTLPVVSAGGLVNAASFLAGQQNAPGGILSIFGSNLAPQGQSGNIPLPTSLAGIGVKIGNIDALLFYAGPNQLNVLLPSGLPLKALVPVIVSLNGKTSPVASVQTYDAGPGIFSYTLPMDSVVRGAVLDGNYSLISPSNPVAAGGVIQIYCTGLGATNPSVLDGTPAPQSSLSYATIQPQVTVGGISAAVSFAGLAPGFAGLYQVNATVPAGVPSGDAILSIAQTVQLQSISSNNVMLAIR
jgi:uncharacterized protein (TIGR03437 family)